MKKICFVTATRAEYGLLKWIMKEVNNSDKLSLQVVVTGAHLLKEQGLTVEIIREDGFVIDEIVDSQLDTSSTEMIADSMGRMAQQFSHVFRKLSPDYVVVLGDRYELLPICNTAFVMKIPIVHISGGDVTEGAIDDGIRNAVTMLATYHFPGTEDSAENIRRMRGTDKNIWVVGEPGLDYFFNEELLDRDELAKSLNLDSKKKWILMTYHAETNDSLENNLDTVRNCCEALDGIDDVQVVMTYANTDFGGRQINEYLEQIAIKLPGKFICIPSLGNLRYLSLMKQVVLVIGNSSSGIIEAPTLKVPVINIGDRQKGRHLCSNITQCGKTYQEIKESLKKVLNSPVDIHDIDFWGDGKTSKRIFDLIKSFS